MALALDEWLRGMTPRLSREFVTFEAYVFEGTPAQITPKLSAWPRPEGVSVEVVSVADLAERASSVVDARELVEREFERVASTGGPVVVAVTGLNVMASLFPSGLLQPIYARLRSGGRVVVLVVPPALTRQLPPSVRIEDWRSAIKLDAEVGKADRLLVWGGA